MKQAELNRGSEQVHVVGKITHHTVCIAERETRFICFVTYRLRDAIPVEKPCVVKLRARRWIEELRSDKAAPIRDVDGRVILRLDFDQWNELLDLAEEGVLETGAWETQERRIQDICWRRLRTESRLASRPPSTRRRRAFPRTVAHWQSGRRRGV